MAASYFCLDLGEHFIRVNDSRKNAKLFDVFGLGITETNETFFTTDIEKVIENEGKKISKLLEESKINKKNVNIILPDGLSYNQIIEMPQLNERELLSAIKYQADQFIPMSIDEVSLDVEILHQYENEKKVLVLISAAPKKIVEKVQKVAEYAGLIPEFIETEISAIGRFLSDQDLQNKQGALFINLGYSTTSLYFFNPQLRLLTQTHTFNIGYQLFLKEISLNLKISQTEAVELLREFGKTDDKRNLGSILTVVTKSFITEIQRFTNLLLSKHQLTAESIYIFNEALGFESLRDILGQFFKLPTYILDANSLIKQNKITAKFKHNLGYFISTFGGNLR